MGSFIGKVGMQKRFCWLVALVLFATGCGDGTKSCSPGSPSGMSIEIYDSETGVLSLCDANVTITNGDSFREVVWAPYYYGDGVADCVSPLSTLTVWEGTYDVTVEKLGYEPWTKTGVRVHSDGPCAVRTTEIQAFMERVENFETLRVSAENNCSVRSAPAVLLQSLYPYVNGAEIIVYDGNYQERFTFPEEGNTTTNVSLALDRPGTYSVTVSKEGYLDWFRDGIVVTEGFCHVNTHVIWVDWGWNLEDQ